MYERMTNKELQPEIAEILQYIGEQGRIFLQQFEDRMKARYDIHRELRFPFGKSYGWGFKYAHKTAHLCYVFFEKGTITVTFQIGDKAVPRLYDILPTLSETARSLWENRYPCGNNGGWIHYRILTSDDLENVIRLIEVRKRNSLSQMKGGFD